MIKISDKFSESVFTQESPIIYGYGNWGKRCIRYLSQKGVEVSSVCDQKWSEYSSTENKFIFISPEELKEKSNSTVIIAVEKFESILLFVSEYTNKIYLYWKESNSIYKIDKNHKVLGCETALKLRRLLESKERIALYGSKKHREDFKYIFENLKVCDEIEQGTFDKSNNEYDLIIQCGSDNEDISANNVINAEDLFTLLTGDNMEHVKAYIMLLKTFSDKMVNQPPCNRPFTNAVINSVQDFHFCCGDWSLGVQNILQNPDLQSIWDSIEAKVYRLSMINRTYSFCNWKRCVYLRAEPEVNPELERLHFESQLIPDSLEIGIDRTCNLFCQSCRCQVIVESGGRLDNINRSKQIIKQSGWLDKCKTLLLGGQGEVFFSPTYKELMYHSQNGRNKLDLRTNGVLLTETEFLKLKEMYGELKIIVSIDAATRETYRKLRRSKDKKAWDKLVCNLEMLSEKRRRKELDFFQINMCVQRDNYAEIPQFVTWGETLNVDAIYLTPIRNWGTFSDEEFEEVSIFNSDKKTLKPEVDLIIKPLRAIKTKARLEIAF